MAITEPRSGLSLVHTWGLGTNNWHTEMDSNLKKLGLFGVHCSVRDRDLATPPGSPSNGDAYIVATSPTGAWTGHTGHVAVWDTSPTTPAWAFGTPREGWLCYIADEDVLCAYNGSAWVIGTGADANTIANGKTGGITQAGARTSLHVGQQTINPQVGTTYAPVTADANNIVTLSNAAAIAVTLPTPTSIGVLEGESVAFVKEGAGNVTYSAGAGATVTSAPDDTALMQRVTGSLWIALAMSTTAWRLIPINHSKIYLSDGAVGAPALAYVTDPTAGRYHTGTGATGKTLEAINGVIKTATTATGFGVGTDSPAAGLQVFSAFGANGQVMICDSANVGINSVALLGFYDSVGARQAYFYREGGSGAMIFGNDSTASGAGIKFTTAGASRAYITKDGNFGLGTSSAETRLHNTGGFTRNVTAVAAATYNILVTDDILDVTYTPTGTVAVQLMTAQMKRGRTIVIKDGGGLAGTNNITISTEGAELIDGAATQVISANYGKLTITGNAAGTGWMVI